jgi:hypothetical protein
MVAVSSENLCGETHRALARTGHGPVVD